MQIFDEIRESISTILMFLFGLVKPGVLRFVPTPTTEGDLNRLPTNTCTSPLGPVRTPIGGNPIASSPVPLTTSNQALSMVKPQKKQRKDGAGNEFENSTRDRDDVTSPAYSDISDDSTPVNETEMSGK